jgi:hypothetical protein
MKAESWMYDCLSISRILRKLSLILCVLLTYYNNIYIWLDVV